MIPLVLALCLCGAGGGCRRHDDGTRTIKIGTVLSASHPTATSLVFFKERLEALSGGSMKVNVFFNSQLGDANEILELMRMGDVEMAQVSSAMLAVYVPMFNVLAMPFIWRDSSHQFRVLDGEFGRILKNHAAGYDLVILGFLDSGTRSISTVRGPITRPEDLAGMKIRVMDAPLMVATINALGASAVALNQGEVYTALQMRYLDGWENNPLTIVNFRMYETGCIYYALTRHFSIPDLLVAGGPFLRSLSPPQRAWLEQAADDAVAHQRRLWAEEDRKALDELAAAGMKINEVNVEPFRARVWGIYEEYGRKYGEEFIALMDMIRRAE